MVRARTGIKAAVFLATTLAFCVSEVPAAAQAADLLRDTLRQQSAAERSACVGIRRTLTAGSNPVLVVRTAVELGYNPCQVIRCALEGAADGDKGELCRNVVQGAVAAGVPSDVIARCSSDACDPAGVAAILAGSLLELNYCYIGFQPSEAPDPGKPQPPVIDRALPQPQVSPYTFPGGP